MDDIDDVTNVHNLTTDNEPFEASTDVPYMVPADQLVNVVINNRFLVKEVMANGLIGTVWSGNLVIAQYCTYGPF